MTLATTASASGAPQHSALAHVWQLLESLTDPEIPVVTLRELGILRDVRTALAQDGTELLEVVITPTYSGCPAMGQIEDDVHNLLQAHDLKGKVKTQLAPAWTTDWITPEAKEKLRAYGIAPPHSGADHDCQTLNSNSNGSGVSSIIQFAARSASNPGRHEQLAVPCPQCNSDNTTETSHFGSTACKALYRCLDCMEPFDYFKP
ncbi:MAG: putative 1,2-phenylacetyl-CoA epoxidase, subunit, partial [Pseudomonadota bacterium]